VSKIKKSAVIYFLVFMDPLNGGQKGCGGIFLWKFLKKNATTPFLTPLGGLIKFVPVFWNNINFTESTFLVVSGTKVVYS